MSTTQPALPATMRAIIRDAYGPPEVLTPTTLPVPTAGPGEVLVRVGATSINMGDRFLLSGTPYVARLAFGLRRPKQAVIGRDLAGEVVAVGPGVTDLGRGDRVYGEVTCGTLTEYAAVRADQLTPAPVTLTYAQAAAVPVAGVTALQAIRDHGRVRPGHRLLINGASGGVGTFAVQLGKHYGAEVTAVCRTRNLDLMRSLGANRVIDYTTTDVTSGDERYDAVLDLAGNHPLAALRRLTAPTGTLVLSSGSGGRWFGPLGTLARAGLTSPFVRQRLVTVVAKPGREPLDALRELIDAGRVTPAIEHVYPLSSVADAIRRLESEHARAKVVIEVSSDPSAGLAAGRGSNGGETSA